MTFLFGAVESQVTAENCYRSTLDAAYCDRNMDQVADSPSDDIRKKFDQICQIVPTEKKTWIDSGGSVQTKVIWYSRLFDLTILGMHEKSYAHNLSH